jgi:hypothetical protein
MNILGGIIGMLVGCIASVLFGTYIVTPYFGGDATIAFCGGVLLGFIFTSIGINT